MAKVKSSMRKYVMALLFVAIGIIIGTSMLCGCTCGKEGFVVPSKFSDVVDGGMQKGVPGVGGESWRKQHEEDRTNVNMLNNQRNESLFFFSKNRFAPECCDSSSVSGSNGCACVTPEQNKFLDSRGGNCASGNCSF